LPTESEINVSMLMRRGKKSIAGISSSSACGVSGNGSCVGDLQSGGRREENGLFVGVGVGVGHVYMHSSKHQIK